MHVRRMLSVRRLPQFPGNWAIIAWKTGVSMMSSYVGGADGTAPEVRRAADDSPMEKKRDGGRRGLELERGWKERGRVLEEESQERGKRGRKQVDIE
jgi:hypothetical protein